MEPVLPLQGLYPVPDCSSTHHRCAAHSEENTIPHLAPISLGPTAAMIQEEDMAWRPFPQVPRTSVVGHTQPGPPGSRKGSLPTTGHIWKPFLTGGQHQPLVTVGRVLGRPPSTLNMTQPQSCKRGARVGLLWGPVVPYLPLLPQVT